MKKTERIAIYREEYLKGKSEEECRKFDEKSVEKQYGAIMAWRRRSGAGAATASKKEGASVNSIVATLKKVSADISSQSSLSEEEKRKLYEALDGARDTLNNYDRNKMAALLQKLESERDDLTRKGEDLTRKIEELRHQLS